MRGGEWKTKPVGHAEVVARERAVPRASFRGLVVDAVNIGDVRRAEAAHPSRAVPPAPPRPAPRGPRRALNIRSPPGT